MEIRNAGLTAGTTWALETLLTRARACGIRATLTSGRRSREKQQELWDNRFKNPYPVAVPGTSPHERGIAFDLAASAQDLLKLGDIWEGMGGHWGGRFSRFDPIHFEWRKGLPQSGSPSYTTA